MALNLHAYLTALEKAESAEALNTVLIEQSRVFGAVALVGHPLPYGSGKRLPAWKPYIATFPDEILELYRETAGLDDPFLEASLAMGTPVHFASQVAEFKWSSRQLKVFELMGQHGIQDGIAMPTMVKPGVTAYFAMGFGVRRESIPRAELRRIYVLFCEYFARRRELTRGHRPTFSMRERQILVNIVKGRSKAEIGKALSLSEHTVDTYMRRCFEKLNVNSRTEAVIKVLGGGLLLKEDTDETPSA